MSRVNEHYLKLTAGYLFPEIARRVAKFAEANSAADVIKLGIGDVTEPLPPAIVEAMHVAVDEMARRDTFRGYGPDQGYEFLREAIVEHDYSAREVKLTADEIFISDGSKCDTGNILDIFGSGNVVAITDPVYPVYVDTNVMAGHTGAADEQGRYEGIVYIPVTAENDFIPTPPDRHVDLVYLCYPNNPTGTVASRDTLQRWVDYAQKEKAVLLYDAAYEAYIHDAQVPHSIYEIDGAREVAIEFRSFSKNAGFTGTRCAFTVVPKDLVGNTPDGQDVEIHSLWQRRQSTKFNGVSYIVQKGAAAVYEPDGHRQVNQLINFYMTNARLLRAGLEAAGITVFGGENAPYIWLKTPKADSASRTLAASGMLPDGTMSSWDFFDMLLQQAHLVGTPGSGFGAAGEGYFRLSAFNSRENVQQAVERFTKAVG